MTALDVRLYTESKEEGLSIYASKSRCSQGRMRWEEPCPLRTSFQRDRDRILYCNAFRRLKHKTQVFVAPLGDHYVTRLTHTLEVSQIARTISRALNLNEDLTEAIALGHDLGHTPFGHLGEDILNELNPEGFRHNEQSLRIVDVLEKKGNGLNLTWEVRDGILNHSKSGIRLFDEDWGEVGTLEGEVVKIADAIAYINHDTNDAIRAGVIKEGDLPDMSVEVLGHSSADRINTLVTDIVKETAALIDNKDLDKPNISMSKKILDATNELRDFLFMKVYKSDLAVKDRNKIKDLIVFHYKHFSRNIDQLPDEYLSLEGSVDRKVTDYISGMTDSFAIWKAEEILSGRKKTLNPFFI
jgi:dGTPase